MEYSISNIITSSPKAPEKSILIIYTGGTLGMVHNASGALVPFDFSSIMDHLPALKNLDLNLTVMSFIDPIDSSNVDPAHWRLIGNMIFDNYDNHDGFVVLHGTDTMAYTASALSFMLQNLSKPVILTGAQLPITSTRSDARENLITALEIASAYKGNDPIVPEVCIYFDYKLLRGNRSKKSESIHFDAFESENYPLLAEAGVVINYNDKYILSPNSTNIELHDIFDPNIAVLTLYPGITKQAVKAITHIPSLRGLILETYGAGNAPTHQWLLDALQESIRDGVVILNVSQCSGGTVDQGRYETSRNLEAIGVVSGFDLTLEAAVAKLMMVLGEEKNMAQIRQKLIKSLSGEVTLN